MANDGLLCFYLKGESTMPRRRVADRQNERQRIQFAFNADLDSAIGVMFNYLIKNPKAPSRAGKHKGVDAMLAFWKPFAYQEQGDLSTEEMKAIARESVELLTRQAELIAETFEVESPKVSSSATPDLRQEVRSAVSEAIQQLVSSGMMGTSAKPLPVAKQSLDSFGDGEGVDFDEDALLGGLLDDAAIAA
jgi:hypothetical protein